SCSFTNSIRIEFRHCRHFRDFIQSVFKLCRHSQNASSSSSRGVAGQCTQRQANRGHTHGTRRSFWCLLCLPKMEISKLQIASNILLKYLIIFSLFVKEKGMDSTQKMLLD